ncbi:Uncharacterised protein [Achromobacter spanius]|uniref:hypothetical protein n=1 Tax=Achromobacter spanius TaxID=217203 RepID=UPI000C2B6DC9|nr:hypothetical protein [Achromobacter spanius]AUA55806.1 hypothetical protein CVS48_07015 [Achromobacter spanius]CAB3638597.1 hypothetical protein LMG5911_01489 [Achromobacter spanius]VEE56682.1 Uncharacterised protein [Achromobacter spanius]
MKPLPHILFACSSALHVKLFTPTLRTLLEQGKLQPVMVSLDSFYRGIHGNVASAVAAQRLDLPMEPISTIRADDGSRLVRTMKRALAARRDGMRDFRQMLVRNQARLLVLGNDTGHLERAAIAAAQSLRIPTLLVQDGFVSDQFSLDWRGRLHLLRTKAWLALGGAQLGRVPYGMGGCDHIAAHGERWAKILSDRQPSPGTTVHITGHPSLDISHTEPGVFDTRDVLYFCTNFLSGMGDAHAHERQIEELLQLRGVLDRRLPKGAILHIKLHPADDVAAYKRLQDVPGLQLHVDIELSALVERVWLCVTNISSAAVENIARGRICLMSGISVRSPYDQRLFSSLPGTKFTTWEEFDTLLDTLANPAQYHAMLDTERQEIRMYFDFRPDALAPARLAELIDLLAAGTASPAAPGSSRP